MTFVNFLLISYTSEYSNFFSNRNFCSMNNAEERIDSCVFHCFLSVCVAVDWNPFECVAFVNESEDAMPWLPFVLPKMWLS